MNVLKTNCASSGAALDPARKDFIEPEETPSASAKAVTQPDHFS